MTTTRRPPAGALTDAEYVALAGFRSSLRGFLRFVEAGARQAGLSPQQHQLLLAVRGQPRGDGATVGELARALQVQPHTAVGLVNRCEHLGLVRRQRESADRRRVRVRLTPIGRRRLDQLTRRNRRELLGLRRALDLALLTHASERTP